ncbi:MAG: S8 family serine peptidase [Saprospiraceae bacterium]|nr:S8 family serine peptidase [Saprospiraceae bacterium]
MTKLPLRHPSVLNASFNYFIETRDLTPNLPNDSLFSQQWHLFNEGQEGGKTGADIKISNAWHLTQGGVTAQGDTIVVAVVDNGTQTHRDLDINRWHNWNEIPNNDIDDDRNGFVDDFLGWNVVSKNDSLSTALSDFHGIGVEGVLGAVGNNNAGVTGVAWRVKMMPVIFYNNVEEVIACYDYVLNMRNLYNKTNGAKGAFIVVSNASLGIPLKPEEAPGWCELLDTMGRVGILNVGAAPNSELNVDNSPDLPAFCPTDLQIVVTASDRNDNLPRGYGYGINNVDVAAPGIEILTTEIKNGYKRTNGTSLAAPIVAGIAALAFTVPCDSLVKLNKTRPTEGVLLLKKMILDNVDFMDNMRTRVKIGGRANAEKPLFTALDLCRPCSRPKDIKPFFVKKQLQFSARFDEGNLEVRFRTKNGLWSSPQSTQQGPLSIQGLKTCTEYDFEIKTVCEKGESDTTLITLKTEGCDVQLIPNPFSNILTIDNLQTSNNISRIEVFTIDGRLVFAKNVNIGNEIVDFDELASLRAGFYLVKMRIGATNVVKKIVKTNP